MKPHSYILAKRIEFFASALQTNIEFIQHINGDAYYHDYKDLTDIKANPYDKILEHSHNNAKENRTSVNAQVTYRNTVLRHQMYNEIVQQGALSTFRKYCPNEEDSYKTFETDHILYRSYIITHNDNKRKNLLSPAKIRQQEKALEKFPDYLKAATELMDKYYHPQTEEDYDHVNALKNAVVTADIFNGHIFSDNTDNLKKSDSDDNNSIPARSYLTMKKTARNKLSVR